MPFVFNWSMFRVEDFCDESGCMVVVWPGGPWGIGMHPLHLGEPRVSPPLRKWCM